MRLRLELEFEAVRLQPGADEELGEVLRTLMRTWSSGAKFSQESLEVCGFGASRLIGVHFTKKG